MFRALDKLELEEFYNGSFVVVGTCIQSMADVSYAIEITNNSDGSLEVNTTIRMNGCNSEIMYQFKPTTSSSCDSYTTTITPILNQKHKGMSLEEVGYLYDGKA